MSNNSFCIFSHRITLDIVYWLRVLFVLLNCTSLGASKLSDTDMLEAMH